MKKQLLIYVFCASFAWTACSGSNEQETSASSKESDKTTEVTKEKEPAIHCSGLELSDLSRQLNVNVTNDDDIKLFREIASWVGAPYKSAGVDKSGADCSGFVDAVFNQVYGIKLPRQTAKIYEQIRSVSKEDAQSGDLVFFRTDGKISQTPNYLGIYLKENRFAVMSSKGFKIESLESSYYKKNFVCVGRVK